MREAYLIDRRSRLWIGNAQRIENTAVDFQARRIVVGVRLGMNGIEMDVDSVTCLRRAENSGREGIVGRLGEIAIALEIEVIDHLARSDFNDLFAQLRGKNGARLRRECSDRE